MDLVAGKSGIMVRTVHFSMLFVLCGSKQSESHQGALICCVALTTPWFVIVLIESSNDYYVRANHAWGQVEKPREKAIEEINRY